MAWIQEALINELEARGDRDALDRFKAMRQCTNSWFIATYTGVNDMYHVSPLHTLCYDSLMAITGKNSICDQV